MKPRPAVPAEAFRNLRRDLFIFQKDAATTLGVAPGTLNRWEMGRKPVPRWAFELLTAWFVGGRKRQ